MSEVTTFSKKHQDAAIGHSLKDLNFWIRLDELGVKKEWFSQPDLSAIYDHIQEFRGVYNRAPTASELEAYLDAKDSSSSESKKRVIARCCAAADNIGLDVIELKLVDWAKSRFIVSQGTELSAAFNKGDHQTAYKIWEGGAVQLQRIDAAVGATPDRMESSATRIDKEAEERYRNGEKLLSYGIPFLDDALVAIPRRDLIVVGASTGVGKTELAKIVGAHNATQKKRVSAFFLEAEEFEIERRIKYSLLLERWLEENPGTGSAFDYVEWSFGKYKDTLDRYGAEVDREFKSRYETLRTYYRVRGDFSIEDLDREILKAHKDSDLIILDHLHYVDLDARNNENTEMGRLVKRIRHLVLGLGVPVLCIAHLKKGAGKGIVPTLDDFHGSSEISKIATTCITMSRCPPEGFSTSDIGVEGHPTYVRMPKFRLGGDRIPYVGVAFYDKNAGGYTDRYALGRLNVGETKWIPMKEKFPRWVKPERIISDAGDGESDD